MSRILIIFTFIGLFLSSCTPSVHLTVLHPAQISIPSHIQQIGLVNRSLAGKKDKVINVLEGILSGESIGADKEGSERSLLALQQALQQTNRYIVTMPAVPFTTSAAGEMNLNEVRAICRQHKLDALVVLEHFDSDSHIEMSTEIRQEKIKEQTVPVKYFIANARLNVRTHWKMYDDSTGNIVDMHPSADYVTFKREGKSELEARNSLPSKREAINRAGSEAGCSYGERIAPYYISVQRMYYKKGSSYLKQAADFVKRNRWQQATDVWKKEASSSDPEVAGRANYNMALACEKEGNLKLAIEYAKTSRDKYQNDKAIYYLRVLENRMRDQAVLEQQLK
jgi:hypothetical protein